MRLAFLCGSLEPGRDGVGDYTRRLGRACRERGHECLLISLCEPPGVDRVGDGDAGELRLSGGSRGASWDHARDALARFHPDWMSLQFVCWSFGRRGLVPGLGRRLRALAPDGVRWHVMFHELWLGLGGIGSWRHRLWGWYQRHWILEMLRELRPAAVHAAPVPYRYYLGRAGVRAIGLEVLGGVEPVAGEGLDLLARAFREQGLGELDRSGRWLGCVFGIVHPQWSEEPLFERMRLAGAAAGLRPTIVFVGRSGRSDEWFAGLKESAKGRVEIARLDEMSAGDVSRVMNAMDFGVSTTPWALVEKSASIATMREHGLPVLVTRDDLDFGAGVPGPEAVEGLWRVAAGDPMPGRGELARGRSGARPVAARVGERFLAALSACA